MIVTGSRLEQDTGDSQSATARSASTLEWGRRDPLWSAIVGKARLVKGVPN